MANVAQVLKEEIAKISRKVMKSSIKEMLRATIVLKKTVAEHKKRLAQLEKDIKLFKAIQAKRQAATSETPPEEDKKARLTSKGIRALRKKLHLTRPDFAKLAGTSPQSVYMWETKEGDLRLRPKTKAALLSFRRIGVREAKRRLAESQE